GIGPVMSATASLSAGNEPVTTGREPVTVGTGAVTVGIAPVTVVSEPVTVGIVPVTAGPSGRAASRRWARTDAGISGATAPAQGSGGPQATPAQPQTARRTIAAPSRPSSSISPVTIGTAA